MSFATNNEHFGRDFEDTIVAMESTETLLGHSLTHDSQNAETVIPSGNRDEEYTSDGSSDFVLEPSDSPPSSVSSPVDTCNPVDEAKITTKPCFLTLNLPDPSVSASENISVTLAEGPVDPDSVSTAGQTTGESSGPDVASPSPPYSGDAVPLAVSTQYNSATTTQDTAASQSSDAETCSPSEEPAKTPLKCDRSGCPSVYAISNNADIYWRKGDKFKLLTPDEKAEFVKWSTSEEPRPSWWNTDIFGVDFKPVESDEEEDDVEEVADLMAISQRVQVLRMVGGSGKIMSMAPPPTPLTSWMVENDIKRSIPETRSPLWMVESVSEEEEAFIVEFAEDEEEAYPSGAFVIEFSHDSEEKSDRKEETPPSGSFVIGFADDSQEEGDGKEETPPSGSFVIEFTND
ncbi:hypothetical protein B0H66DRAFT_596742 [Apodospora peruviana]|uniref:Uncharacterized protein n=1 Tax=Apodospora peruviana TaxID=516989 RepID=A0AAE0IPU1_9PEZI|nr:hypothetical protein B0H66DRAFT_596742 [Apodospora peruviana]